MPSLNDNFNELIARIRQGREWGHASFEPIYYLVFSPRQILDVKRALPAWTARLSNNDGWTVHRFSMAAAITDILDHAPQRKIWLAADRRAPLHWDRTNQALANALSQGALEQRLQLQLDQLSGSKAILLVTELEALHPYMRIGTIEGRLSGAFRVPTIFFYPGTRTGKTGLKFLGFYPEDGNYRSVHVGG